MDQVTHCNISSHLHSYMAPYTDTCLQTEAEHGKRKSHIGELQGKSLSGKSNRKI